jgi:hypothetical protein
VVIKPTITREELTKSGYNDNPPAVFKCTSNECLNNDIILTPGQNDSLLLSELQKCEISYQWFMIGIQLMVNRNRLKIIEADHKNDGVERCMAEMIFHWCQSTATPYLSAILKALIAIGHVGEAEVISNKYRIDFSLITCNRDSEDHSEFSKQLTDCVIDHTEKSKFHCMLNNMQEHGQEQQNIQQSIREIKVCEEELKKEIDNLKEEMNNVNKILSEMGIEKSKIDEQFAKKKRHLDYLKDKSDAREIYEEVKVEFETSENDLKEVERELFIKQNKIKDLENLLSKKKLKLAEYQRSGQENSIKCQNVTSVLLTEQSYLQASLHELLMREDSQPLEAQRVSMADSDNKEKYLSLSEQILVTQNTLGNDEKKKETLSSLRLARAKLLCSFHDIALKKSICISVLKSDIISSFLLCNKEEALELLKILPDSPLEMRTQLTIPNWQCGTLSNVTLLHLACKNNWLDVIDMFVKEYHCSLSIKSSGGYTPLHFACLEGHLEVVRYLVHEFQVSVREQNELGKNTLHMAAEFGHSSLVQFLLESTDIDVIEVDRDGNSVFHLAQGRDMWNILETTFGNINSVVRVLILGQDHVSPMKLEGMQCPLPSHTCIIPISKDDRMGTVMYTLPDHVEVSDTKSLLNAPCPTMILITLPSADRHVDSTLKYWLQFVQQLQLATTTSKLGLAIAVNDSKSPIDAKEEKIKEQLSLDKFAFVEIFSSKNSTLTSSNLQKLISRFRNSTSDDFSSLSANCFFLYYFVKKNVSTAMNFKKFYQILSEKVSPLLMDQLEVANCFTALSNRGLIVFLKNESSLDDSLLVLEPVELLKSLSKYVTVTYVNPEQCRPILHLPELASKDLFTKLEVNPRAIADFLCYYQFCKKLNCHSLQSIFTNTNYDLNEWFYCPSLLSSKQESGTLVVKHSFTSTWLLRCVKGFFPKNFTQALCLYFAYVFQNKSCGKLEVPLIKGKKLELWRESISWQDQQMTKVTVDTYEQNQVINVHFSSEEIDRTTHVFLRTTVISAVLKLKAILLPNVDVEENLVRQSTSVYHEVPVKRLVQAIVKGDSHVPDLEGSMVLVKDVITFDCFECVRYDLIKKLFDPIKGPKKVKDKFLKALADCMSVKQDPQILGRTVFCSQKASVIIHRNKGKPAEQIFKLLCNWRDCDKEKNYHSLQLLLSNYSICAGRNPLDWFDRERFPTSLSSTFR